MKEKFELAGRKALVTGGSRGIGRAITERLASLGAEVLFTYRVEEAAANEVVDKIVTSGGVAHSRQLDLVDKNAASTLAKYVLETIQSVDILVNNGGTIYRPGGWLEIEPNLVDDTLAQHVRAPIMIARQFCPGMVERGYGRVINISSTYGMTGAAPVIAYTAAKAAMISVTRSLARELGADGVTVNAIAPGNIDTDLTRGAGEEVLEWTISTTPAGRLGTTDEIADAAEYLTVSPFTTGTVLVVDGGQLLNM